MLCGTYYKYLTGTYIGTPGLVSKKPYRVKCTALLLLIFDTYLITFIFEAVMSK